MGLLDQMYARGRFGAYREYLGGITPYSGEVRFFNEGSHPCTELRPARQAVASSRRPIPSKASSALEDLEARGAVFARATRPLNVKLAAAGLDTLAALHGH